MINLYRRLVLGHPEAVIVLVLAVAAFFGFFIKDFKLDASGESLLLEDDPALRQFEAVSREFGSDTFALVTLDPNEALITQPVIEKLRLLVEDLAGINGVSSVNSILDAPLFHSPKVPLILVATNYKTLLKPGVDLALARKELCESPVYRDLLISADGEMTAIKVNFAADEALAGLAVRREELRGKRREGMINQDEQWELDQVSAQFRDRHALVAAKQRQMIAQMREILVRHKAVGTFYLGGVPLIVADMISFVESDLLVFGIGVLVFLVLALAVIFRDPRWVVLPLLTCLITGAVMLGYLGLVDWRITVVSSNFNSLLFIMTMSMSIHIVVRYRELHAADPEREAQSLVLDAVSQVAKPCFYCALTTMVGFGSLVVSGIRPVIDFGLMMTIGLAVAYAVAFLFLPAAMLKWPKGKPPVLKVSRRSPTEILANISERRGLWVVSASVLFFALGGIGFSMLQVENRFIDYFKADTDIHRGMVIIDKQLGGTTPLDIVIDGGSKDFWIKGENLDRLRKIHDYLEGLPQTGNVLSLDSMIRVVEGINGGNRINPFILSLVRKALPEKMSQEVLRPFVSEDFSRIRISLRVRDTDRSLQRDEFLAQVRHFFDSEAGLPPQSVTITGLLVLYNNMLQSLFRSQILTLGMVLAAIFAMFVVLFRSFRLALIGIIPNMLPVIMVLGLLGLLGIPLDMMTIMIAAVTMGIAVDQTIHYIHRFKREMALEPRGDRVRLMHTCHNSIGKAMYYTSVTIVVGFSILALSNFLPTIYFGLLTGLAMIVALFASMTLLPILLIRYCPE